MSLIEKIMFMTLIIRSAFEKLVAINYIMCQTSIIWILVWIGIRSFKS